MFLLSPADFFQNKLFKRKIFRKPDQSVFGLDPDQDNILSVLVWVQIVCKGYQQMTKVTTSKESSYSQPRDSPNSTIDML